MLSQCEPIEEGKSHTITCSGAACNNPLLYKWSTFPARPASQHIAHCDTTMDCTGNNNFFAIDVAQDGVGYISNLTIRRVSLTEPFNNELTWTCDYCGQRVKSCALQIFGTALQIMRSIHLHFYTFEFHDNACFTITCTFQLLN